MAAWRYEISLLVRREKTGPLIYQKLIRTKRLTPHKSQLKWLQDCYFSDEERTINRPFALKSHVTSFFMKMKVIWFCLRKTISGSYPKQNKWFGFSNVQHILKMSKFVAGHLTKCDFENYELPLSEHKFCT